MTAEEFVKKLEGIYFKNKSIMDPVGGLIYKEVCVPLKIESKTCDSFFECLYKNYSVGLLQPMKLCFWSEYEDSDELFWFATYDEIFDVVLNKLSGEIEIIEDNGQLKFAIAPNLDVFLNILIIVAEYDVKGFTPNGKYTDEDSIEIINKCKNLVKDEYFFPFYEHIYGASIK
ncbi:MAG: hypothetical protein NT150_01170 [Bacteroidetes bacterium]|nr:hypothetical protein [Bacteroidota bacterium]